MNFKKEYLNLIKPLIVGLPFTVVIIVLVLVFTNKAVDYINPKYQAKGTIKVDVSEINNQPVSFNQYPTMVDKGNAFLTEVEYLKSRGLKMAALSRLDFELSYYRIGEVQTSEIYHDSPFLISYKVLNKRAYDKLFNLIYLGDEMWLLEWAETSHKVCTGELTQFAGLELIINKNEAYLANYPSALNDDVFAFKIWSARALLGSINDENFLVKPVDKSIHIANIYYSHEHPEKAKAFIDALMASYVENDKDRRYSTFFNSLDFVNGQLEQVGDKLRKSEFDLAMYKQSNQMVNSEQETSSTIAKIRDLDLQKVDLDMREAEMSNLLSLFEQGFNVEYITPNFESIKDKVFEATYYQLYNYEIEKKEVLLKYTQESEEYKLVQSKIDALHEQIIAGLQKSVLNIAAKRKELYSAIEKENAKFSKYPAKERKLVELQRGFKLNEQTYNFLYTKKMELEIMKAGNNSMHEVIDEAQIPIAPIWPNKPLIYGVALFAALLFSIGFSYLWFYLMGRVSKVDTLAHYAGIPVLATVYKARNGADVNEKVGMVAELQNNLELVKRRISDKVKNPIVVISSNRATEGKSFVALNLAKAYAEAGKKVLVMDMDLICPDMHETLGLSNNKGMIDFLSRDIPLKSCIQKTETENLHFLSAGELKGQTSAPYSLGLDPEKLSELKKEYDLVVVDTPPLGEIPDASLCMQMGDINLFLVNREKSRIREIKSIKKLQETYGIKELQLVLNGIKYKHSYYSKYRYMKAKGYQRFKPAFFS